MPSILSALALAAALPASGCFFIVNSLRHREMTVVAPFRHTDLVVAGELGWRLWGEVPNGLAWAGIAVRLAAGLVLLREGRGPLAAAVDQPAP